MSTKYFANEPVALFLGSFEHFIYAFIFYFIRQDGQNQTVIKMKQDVLV